MKAETQKAPTMGRSKEHFLLKRQWQTSLHHAPTTPLSLFIGFSSLHPQETKPYLVDFNCWEKKKKNLFLITAKSTRVLLYILRESGEKIIDLLLLFFKSMNCKQPYIFKLLQIEKQTMLGTYRRQSPGERYLLQKKCCNAWRKLWING